MLRKSSMLLYKRVQKFQQRQKKPPSHATGKSEVLLYKWDQKLYRWEKKPHLVFFKD